MKIQVVSDLHLSVWPFELLGTDADIVVVAGDVGRPKMAIEWLAAIPKRVLFVAGNHEFYGGAIDTTRAELKQLARGTRVQVLDDDETILDGVRFLGSTLWTDFMLFGAGPKRAAALDEARKFLRDFTRIHRISTSDALYTPEDSVELFRTHVQWLRERLASRYSGPTVVITHHAPSPSSIHPRFTDSLLNACFVSDLTRTLDGSRAVLWIHGHTHDSFDYDVNGTRVVCNPRGYAKGGVNENRVFDPQKIVNVG